MCTVPGGVRLKSFEGEGRFGCRSGKRTRGIWAGFSNTEKRRGESQKKKGGEEGPIFKIAGKKGWEEPRISSSLPEREKSSKRPKNDFRLNNDLKSQLAKQRRGVRPLFFPFNCQVNLGPARNLVR